MSNGSAGMEDEEEEEYDVPDEIEDVIGNGPMHLAEKWVLKGR